MFRLGCSRFRALLAACQPTQRGLPEPSDAWSLFGSCSLECALLVLSCSLRNFVVLSFFSGNAKAIDKVSIFCIGIIPRTESAGPSVRICCEAVVRCVAAAASIRAVAFVLLFRTNGEPDGRQRYVGIGGYFAHALS